MVVNSRNQVALRWTINPNGKTVQIKGTDVYYVFEPRNHVVMAWINSEHVPALMAVWEKGCNCGNGAKKHAFEYNSLVNTNLWMFNNREGSLESDYKEVNDG